jgi:hypothetical protein
LAAVGVVAEAAQADTNPAQWEVVIQLVAVGVEVEEDPLAPALAETTLAVMVQRALLLAQALAVLEVAEVVQ